MRNRKYMAIPLCLCLFTSGPNAMQGESEEPKEQDKLASLPDLPKSNILEFLGMSDLANLLQTSRSFKDFISADKTIGKKIAYQINDRIDSLRLELEAAEEFNTEEKLLEIHYRLLKLLHLHSSEVGEKLASIPDSSRQVANEYLSSSLSEYYNILLTKVPKKKFKTFKNAIEQELEDRPNRNRHIRKAAMIFCNLDLPKQIDENLRPLLEGIAKNPRLLVTINEILIDKCGLSNEAVITLLMNKVLAQKDEAPCYCMHLQRLTRILVATAFDQTYKPLLYSSNYHQGEGFNLPILGFGAGFKKLETFWNEIPYPKIERADQELEILYIDILDRSIGKQEQAMTKSMAVEVCRKYLMIQTYAQYKKDGKSITKSKIPSALEPHAKKFIDMASRMGSVWE